MLETVEANKSGQHGNGARCHRVQNRAFREQKPEAKTPGKDAAHEPQSVNVPSRELPL
jgi:hypothetical protein